MPRELANVEELARVAIDCGFRVHERLGPGLPPHRVEVYRAVAPVHRKQVLTYLRLMDLPLGLLMNFGGGTFKEGLRRIVNNHTAFASSREPTFCTSIPKAGQTLTELA